MMKRIIGALVGCLIATAAFGQAQVGPGNMLGNTTATRAPAADSSLISIFDRAMFKQPSSYVPNITFGHTICAADSDCQFGNAWSQYPLGAVSTNPILIGKAGSTIGSSTNLQTFKIVFTSTGLSGSPITITYTAGVGETTSTVATGLCVLVNANTTLHGTGGKPIFCQALGAGVFNLQYDSAFGATGATPLTTATTGSTGTITLAGEQDALDAIIFQLGRNATGHTGKAGDSLYAFDWAGQDSTGTYNTHFAILGVSIKTATAGATRGLFDFSTAANSGTLGRFSIGEGVMVRDATGALPSGGDLGPGTLNLPSTGYLNVGTSSFQSGSAYTINLFGGTAVGSSLNLQSTQNGAPTTDFVQVTTNNIVQTKWPHGGGKIETNIAAPASPSAGFVHVFSDSTDLRMHDKNSAGTIGTTVVADTGASNNFLTAISASGVISKAQPTFSNLATGTAPAFTLGGTVSGGGNQINNVVIGTVTPLAGTFTALAGTTLNLAGDIIDTKSGVLSMTFTSSASTIGVTFSSSGGTAYYFQDTAAGANQKYFQIISQAGVSSLKDLTDAGGAQHTYLTMTHSTGVANFPGGIASTSSTTGTVTITGGLGVAGDIYASGNYGVTTAAKTLLLKQGANGAVGTFVCNGVTPVTVNNTNVAVTDAVVISLNTVGGTVGAAPDLKTITGATGFTVACTAADTSTYNYALIKNAA